MDYEYELSIDVSIRNYRGGGGALQLRETTQIMELNFHEMAEILNSFHEITQAIKRTKEVKKA